MIRLSTRPGRAGYPALALAALAQFALSGGALGADGAAIAWRTDLGSAQAESRARNLPLWIQFTGPWCINCRRMERGSFVNPHVAAAAHERFVPVKLRSDEYEQLALSLGLSSLPSTVIVRPDGRVIDKWEGFGEPGEFLAFLDQTHGRFLKEARVEVALASYCPVSLVDKKQLVRGKPDLMARRDGLEYHFAHDEARRAFLASPERYAPANRGECPVRKVDGGVFQPGDPRWGILYRGHLYVCADASERERFLKNPERYANVDVAAMASCPHCWTARSGVGLAQAPDKPAPSTATRRSSLPSAPAVMEALLAPVSRLRR